MRLYVLRGLTVAQGLALLIQLLVVQATLLKPGDARGDLVRADNRRHDNGWRRERFEWNAEACLHDESDTADSSQRRVLPHESDMQQHGGQKNFLCQLCGSKPTHNECSNTMRPPPAALTAPAYQSDVVVMKPRFRFLQHQNFPFGKMSGNGTGTKNRQEVSVLVSMKAAIQDPLGVLRSWHSNASTACGWVGVSCSFLNDGQHVTSLVLSGHQLVGDIDSILVALARLNFLQHLDLSVNGLHGALSDPVLANMASLQYVFQQKPTLPEFLETGGGTCPSLRHLHIRLNHLSGEIPESLGKLPNLVELALSRNSLTGGVPKSITNSTRLVLLSLSFNNLRQDLSNLSFESLSRTLQFLLLNNNSFTGVIPTSLANCSSLQILLLGSNHLNPQTIPEWVVSFSSLTHLDLSSMQLQGEIPKDIGKLQNLDYLYVTGNNLSGAIPSSLSNCTFLTELGVDDNQLTGPIPPELGLTNLEYIFATHNSLTGSIPISFTNLTGITYLMLGGNFLSGSIEGLNSGLNWAKMPQLYNCDLSGNHLEGSIPSYLGNNSQLLYLNLSHDHFTGLIPASLTTNLSIANTLVVDLSFNELSGELPQSLFKSPHVVGLFLRNNNLEGALPSEVGESANLETLDLSGNRLEQELPESLGNCSKLGGLYLHDNQFRGRFSTFLFGEIVNLRYLDLSSTLFSGPWPEQLSTLQNIQFVSLSKNNFSGPIMGSQVQSMLVLQSLDVSNNNFDGLIPASLGFLSALVFINFSYNNFQGPIPGGGIFDHNLTSTSFLGNPGLCGVLLGSGWECLPQASAPLSPRGNCKGFARCRRVWMITICVGSSFLLAFIVITMLWWCKVKKRRHQTVPSMKLNTRTQFRLISEEEIQAMISSEQVIGHGASSVVYKGSRPGGETFAIKILGPSNIQSTIKPNIKRGVKCTSACRHNQEQVLQEVHTLAQLCHRNILRVVSFCSRSKIEAIILEYMPQGNLHKHLYTSEGHPCQLSFHTRLGIMINIAEAMKYLHHDLVSPLIHGDLKPTNILLDHDFTAKIADFGISKFACHKRGGDGAEQDTSASTIHVHGTVGYIPPEYAVEGRISTRGDVYSYGVVLLEVLTCKPPTEDCIANSPPTPRVTPSAQKGPRAGTVQGSEDSLPSGGYQILSLYNEDSLQMLDKKLLEKSTLDLRKREQLKLLLLVALLCTKDRPQSRPKMSDVLLLLAQVNRMGNNLDAARKTIEELLKEDPR